MTQPCAKSKVVEGINGSTVVAKSKDYSIYSQVYEVLKEGLKKGVDSKLPQNEVMMPKRKNHLEHIDKSEHKILMICNKAERCGYTWSCKHQAAHWNTPACYKEIPDKLCASCYGAKCKEVVC